MNVDQNEHIMQRCFISVKARDLVRKYETLFYRSKPNIDRRGLKEYDDISIRNYLQDDKEVFFFFWIKNDNYARFNIFRMLKFKILMYITYRITYDK